MTNNAILKILITLLIAISLSYNVLAGPMPLQDITFNFQISQEQNTSLNNGEWKIYFISIGEFEKDNWNFTKYYDNITKNYLDFKKNCGKDNTFYTEIYKMSDEEKKHKGCVINDTYQEEYCFKTTTNNNKCLELIPYKIDDKNELNFFSYYSSHMWDINKADWYNHFEPAYCDIINNSCIFKIHKESYPYNSYIIILEKLNSTNEIYFSDKLNINDVKLFYDQSIFPSDAVLYHVNLEMELNLTTFKIRDPNKLIISFSNSSKILNKENLTIYTTDHDSNYSNSDKPEKIKSQKENFFKRTIIWIKKLFN